MDNENSEWSKKDLIHLKNVVEIIQDNVKFNNMSAADVVRMSSAFGWLDSLGHKIEAQMQKDVPIVPVPKGAGLRKPK